MKKIFLLTAFISIVMTGYSQDFISLKRGARVEAVVTEITPTLVRYRLFNEPRGRVYFMYKDDVVGIMYQNGRIEIFGDLDEQVTERRSDPNENQNQYQPQIQNQEQNQQQPQIQFQPQQSSPTIWDQADWSENERYVKSNFSHVHVGFGLPYGSFAEGDVKKDDFITSGKGFAGMGFNAGYRYYLGLPVKNLSAVFGIEAFYNEVNSDIKKIFKESNIEEDSNFDYTYTLPMFFNFPVTLGLNYAIPISKIKLYAEAAGGGNFSMITKASYKYTASKDNWFEGSGVITPNYSYAYGAETGIIINNKISIGFRYNNLGWYKYKYEDKDVLVIGGVKETDTVKGEMKKSMTISNISARLGFLF